MFTRRKDTEYAADLKAQAMRGPRLSANLLLYAIALFFAAAVGWAAWATLDEVTSGQGRVIPSSQVQVVQNLEGGILSGILVREGEVVEVGQLLLRIDDTGAASAYRENRARYLALVAKIARLYAEARGRKPKYPPELDGHDDLIARESALYRARLASSTRPWRCSRARRISGARSSSSSRAALISSRTASGSLARNSPS